MPEAPAEKHAGAFSSVIPPMAKTGIATEVQSWARRSRPWGAPYAALDGVAKTGPKKM
jgi:hypothetical protein